MSNAALGAALLATALVLMPRAGAAQTGSSTSSAADAEAITLVYEDSAPPDCPSESDFRAEVTKLTSKARFTKQRGARRIRIELDSRGTDVLGRLITGDGKNQSSREVRGKDCKEVSSALAIAVALTIDPEALGAEPEPPKQEPSPQPAPAPKAHPTEPPQQPPKPPPKPIELLWGLGAGLTLESAWAPQMRPGGHVFALLGIGERLRISLGGTRFPTREDDDLSFDAWFGHGNVSYNLALLGVLRPFAALGYEAGSIYASGSGLSTQVEAQRAWQALSAGLGLRFETEGFFLQLGGCLLVPISRQRYLISDPFGELRPIYEVPRFGLRQETSLGVFL